MNHPSGHGTRTARSLTRFRRYSTRLVVRRASRVLLAAVLFMLGLGLAPAHSTRASPEAPAANEWDLTTPTAWSWHHDLSGPALTDLLTSQNERLVELEVISGSPLRFSAATVGNTGAYAKPAWFYYNVTEGEINTLLTQNQGRLIDIEAYNAAPVGELILYAVVMVPNTGADEKGWAWFPAATTTFIGERLDEYNARLIDLDGFSLGGQRRYAAIMIGNTGADHRDWGWAVGQTWPTINGLLANARLLEVIHEGGDTFTVIFEGCPCAGWWYAVYDTQAELRARIAQLGARVIDLEHYVTLSGGLPAPHYSAVLVDNLDAETRRISNILAEVDRTRTYGLYLKEVGGPVRAAVLADMVHEPLSSIKVIAHLYAMRQVQAGNISLDDTIPSYGGTVLPGENCMLPDGGQKPLEDVLADMMGPSSNTDWAAIVGHFGKDNLQTMVGSIGMNQTEIRRVACADLLNRWTLEDAGRLYEGVANGSLLGGAARQDFYALMNGKQKPWYDELVDEEAPAGMSAADILAFKALFAVSRKDGSWNRSASGEIPSESAYTRVGLARLPGCLGPYRVTRSLVYGVFQNGPQAIEAAIQTATAVAARELLRVPIREALALWPDCSPRSLAEVGPLGGLASSDDGRLHITVPAGAFTETLTLYYTPELSPTVMLPPLLVELDGFHLEAVNAEADMVTQFAGAFTVEVSYSDAELAAAGVPETGLQLAYLDRATESWIPIATLVTLEDNIASAQLQHLTEFALGGTTQQTLYLPLITR